ncbi:TPA: fimbrial protein [Escherichia coli]|nr:fimbrial protein [Escherichia coli]
MKYNNIIFLGLCLGLTTYSALSADSVIKISGRVLDYGCTVSSDSLNFTVDLQKNSARQFPTTGSTSPVVPFQITLSECSKGTTGVRVAFNGIEDAENNTLLKLDEGSLQSYKGSLYWNNVTYPFPLTTNTNVLDIGDKTPMPLPLKLYITPVGAAGGVVIKAGEVIARIHMYKIATLGSGNPRNFTWNIISNNSVVMPTGGCTVDSRNVTVNLPDFPGSAEIPLGVYCSSEQKLSFYLSGATTDSARQVFANAAPDATKASGVGVSLIRNGKILATGENVSLGTVNKSKVPLGLSATYGQTGNKVAAGAVQSVIGVTFIYE